MKVPILISLFLSSLIFTRAEPLPLVSPQAVGLSAEKLQKVDEVAKSLVEKKHIAGCVIAVAKQGKIAYLNAFGHQDIKAGKSMTPDTVFRIYSMTKSITSAAAMMLVDEGKVGLDDPLDKYIPGMEKVKVHGSTKDVPTPTVRDLMRHTAGLTYGFFGDTEVDKLYQKAKVLDDSGTLKDMADKLPQLPLLYEPGKDWVYSIASDVLGYVVEKASGKTLDVFFQERLFKPLGMKDTGFYVRPDQLDRFAVNYGPGKGILTVVDSATKSKYLKKPTFFSGGGGLVSTTRDYVRFLTMIQNGGTFEGKRYLKTETVDLMRTDQLPEEAFPIAFGEEERPGTGFGLGFNVRVADTKWDAGARVGEYGWGGAASTHYWVSPKDDLIVVTMEQLMPYSFNTEWAVKKLIYDAIED